MEFVIVTLVLLATALVTAVAFIPEEDFALLRALVGMFIFFIGISVGVIASNENSKPTTKEKQPKYKQEIVYSLKDGKYLPTDTLYTEIK